MNKSGKGRAKRLNPSPGRHEKFATLLSKYDHTALPGNEQVCNMINSWTLQTSVRLRDACLYLDIICFVLPINLFVLSPDKPRTSKLDQREEHHSF